MKKITLMAVLLINSIVYSQDSKKEIINEIETYKKGKLLNTTYNFTYKEVFDAMTIMGNQYYGNSVKESESRGYVEFIKETGEVKEYLSIEIKGDKQPYRLSFNYKKEKKATTWKTEGEFGKPDYKLIEVDAGWKIVEEPLDIIYTNLHLRIYKILYGEFKLPEDLIKKIENFNNTQKKDRKKVLAGVDYEI
jgi:hypothetical protein